MPKSSRHKSYKLSKHSSRDYSDSEEDVVKIKEKISKDDSVRAHRDSASGEKRNISSQLREGKDSKYLNGHGNGDVLEEYVSSKRRKEKTDVAIGGRWNGGGDERGDNDRNLEKDLHKGDNLKVDSKGKDNGGKGESVRVDSKNKSKRYESGNAGERKEDNLTSAVVDREDSKSRGEKRKSERDSSARKEGKELKDKDRRSDKEKNGGHESKSGVEMKLVDMYVGKKQGPLPVDFIEERRGKCARENAERALLDELRNPDLEKETDKKVRRKREGSTEREKHYDDAKDGDERQLSSKDERAKDVKYGDDKNKDGVYSDKYQDDIYRDDRRREEKCREEADKDYKYQDDKYREHGEKKARHRDDRHHEDSDRDSRRKDEKHREAGEQDSKRKDEKYRLGVESDDRRNGKYYEDGDRDNKCKDYRYHEDSDRANRHGDERYNEDLDRDERRRENICRDNADRDNWHKEEKYREDSERDMRHKDSKQGDGYDRNKRSRDGKYKDERAARDCSRDKYDLKRSRDDNGTADHCSRKSSAYDDSPTHDDRTSRSRDDQGRGRTNEQVGYIDTESRGSKDQRSDAEKKSTSSARMDLAADRIRSASRNVDLELTSHGCWRSSPTPNSHAPRDHHRTLKQDDSKYRDYNYEERIRPSSRDHAGAVGGSEKTPPCSVEKLGPRDDGHFGELSAERCLKFGIRSSPLQLVDKSPSSTDRRQFSRPDVRRGIDIEESAHRSGGSRDWKDYPGKEARRTREAMDGEEIFQGDADASSVSSPISRTGHFSNGSKPFPPPPLFRTGVDSPLGSGLGDDDGRGKPIIRHRRVGDPNMGRIQSSPWRGVPGWPSPMANGFLPFPHAPAPIGFHSVMQPFPAPPMFGVGPSIELNHPGAYHMPEADRFSVPGRPMGWHNSVDDSCHPLHAWDASNSVFGDESHIYGRSDWDHSRNLHGNRAWDTSGEFWKRPNRTESMQVPSSEKENNSVRSGDDALESPSTQAAPNDQNQIDQQADIPDVSQPIKSFEKSETEANLGDTGCGVKMLRNDGMPFCYAYLSKLEISTDLAEPELLNKCKGLIGIEERVSSDVDDYRILYIEKSISLYKSRKKTFSLNMRRNRFS